MSYLCACNGLRETANNTEDRNAQAMEQAGHPFVQREHTDEVKHTVRDEVLIAYVVLNVEAK